MSDENDLKDAREQLSLVLSFFPRLDAKLSTLLAIDTAMLATLSASLPPIQRTMPWMAVAPVSAFLLIVASYTYLYRGGFPNVKGGQSSIVFFKEIAGRTEAKFINDYCAHTQKQLRHDVLGQVWRNSEIIAEKFRCLKLAFVLCALAAIPWSISLAVFALSRSDVQIITGHK